MLISMEERLSILEKSFSQIQIDIDEMKEILYIVIIRITHGERISPLEASELLKRLDKD